ncbi:hypothetical protein J6590_035144 [Homalodisca vitripennis]|nr:hypothetical protein J6590_035144 [Homalodisca vitripennis]
MEGSPFLRNIRRLYKIVVGYNVETRKFNLWIACSSISNAIALSTTLYKFSCHKVPKTELVEQLSLTAGFILLLLNSAAMHCNRNKLGELIDDILEPVKTSEETTFKVKEIKRFTNWINLLGAFIMISIYVTLCCLMATIKPLITLKFTSKAKQVQDLPLFFGWIPFSTDSYVVYAVAIFIDTISTFGAGIFCTFIMTLTFAALKIKLRLKLLAADVRNMEEIVYSRTTYKVMKLSTTYLVQLRPCDKIRISIQCRNTLMKEIIDRHIGIIQ